MNTIIITRHAEKQTSNDAYSFIADPPLTDKGKDQALEVKEFVKDHKIDAMFTSIYRRAIETSNILNQDRNLPIQINSCFNEYYVRNDGTNVETTSMGIARTMTYIFSLFDLYQTISIVGHKSINQTILQTLLNLEWDESLKYFSNNGETHILRYDYKLGDKNWHILKSLTPKQ